MMLEILSYLTVLPLPVCMLVVCLVAVFTTVFIRSFFSDMAPSELPELYFRESSLNSHVIAKCKMNGRHFAPCLWLSCRHVQTTLTLVLPGADVSFEREYLQMKDKGVVALDWVSAPKVKVKKKSPVLLVIPAVGEGAVSVSRLCHQASGRGFRTLVVNRRGEGGSVLTTPKLVSFGDPSDLRQVIKYLRLRMPKAPITAVAFGTGCGLLLSYLGEFGSSALLAVGACVSPCYEIPSQFTSGLGTFYDLLLLFRLKNHLLKHAKALTMSAINVDQALSCWSIPQLEQSVYCPLYGYSNLDQFWEANHPMRDVDDISVPILCINSQDDPIFHKKEIPYQLFRTYPNFLLSVTKQGGHCGFLEGFPPKSWSNSLCLDYIEEVIDFTNKEQKHSQTRPRYYSVSSSGSNSTQTRTSIGNRMSSLRARTSSLSKKRSTERFTI